jgi:hypothetical protein
MPLIPAQADDVVRSAEEVARLFPWLKTDLIRGIPHFISPAWAADKSQFDPDHYAATWARIGFETVTLLTQHHDGFQLWPSAHTKAQPTRDFFGEQVAACRKRDIRVIAYYSLSLNSLVGSEHPEWRIRDVHDRVLVPDHKYFFHYHWLCVNSPFRDFVRAQLRELAERYPIVGYWLDILYLPPHPPACDLKEGQDTCFCEHCHRAYSEWFGGEHLTDAFGTTRHDEFRAESYRRFLIEVKRDLLKLPRPLLLSFNGAGKRRHPFNDRVDELSDYYTGEAHHPPARCLWTKLLPQDGRPYELMSCAELEWSHNVAKPLTLIQLESLATLIGGGTYTLGINHAPDGRLSAGNMDRLAEWGAWVRTNRPLLTGGQPVAEIGLLEAGQCCLVDRPTAIWKWVEWLRNGHFLFTIVRTLDAAHAPRALIVPAALEIDDELAIALEAYVRHGGRLLVEGPLARRNTDGPFMLESLVGCAPHGTLRGYGFYLQPATPAISAGLLADEPVYFQCGQAQVLHCATARPLAHLVPQFMDKVRTSDIQNPPNWPATREQADWHPGITINQVGKGRVIACALQLTCADEHQTRHPWPHRLAINLLNELLGGQAVRLRGHECVEVLATRRGDAITLHFLNHQYDAGDFISGAGECEQLADIEIELGGVLGELEAQAQSEPDGKPLPLAGRRLVLPRLGLYQAVVVRQSAQANPAAVTSTLKAQNQSRTN